MVLYYFEKLINTQNFPYISRKNSDNFREMRNENVRGNPTGTGGGRARPQYGPAARGRHRGRCPLLHQPVLRHQPQALRAYILKGTLKNHTLSKTIGLKVCTYVYYTFFVTFYTSVADQDTYVRMGPQHKI